MRRLNLSLVAMLITTTLASGSARAAEPLTCGAVVTQDVTLEANLADCPGDGLVVGRSGITIDLNGYAIRGIPDENQPGTAGIRIDHHDDVNIEGQGLEGSEIAHFEVGVLLNRAGGNRVRGLNVRSLSHNFFLHRSDGNRIEDNSAAFAGIDDNGPCNPGDPAGIFLSRSDGNHVRGNTAQLGLYGITLVRSHHNWIEHNQAAPWWSDGNECEGIALFHSDHNRVADNTAANNNPHGIYVSKHSDGNVLAHNVTFQNADEGIHVDNRRTVLEGNIAVSNTDIGIDAVRGITDAGDNRASGNYGPVQCRNVLCGEAPPVP